MKVAISDRVGEQNATGSKQWFVSENHEALLQTLRLAAERAAQQARPALASITCAVEWHDALRAFTGARRAGLGECFFWERPVEQKALVGTGAATTIETSGTAYFSDAASAWRALMHDAVVAHVAPETSTAFSGPVLFGGFAFDPLSPRTTLWAGFPDGLLILPRMLLSYSADGVTLTSNRMMQATDDAERCAQEIEADVGQLQRAVERIPVLSMQNTERELDLHEVRPASGWMAIVASTVEMIRQGAFEKVVLARDIQLTHHDAQRAFDIGVTLQRLRESYPGAYVFAIQRGERFFVGATPEQLVLGHRDGQIQTMALAGSARRGESEEEDAQIGMELLRSEKNNSEHAIVVAMVQEALEKHCTSVHASAAPELLKLRNLQHLKTPIAGELKPGRCILDIMADLHPTPAVGGYPRQAALEAIRHTEKLDRGWYAAPLGWIGMSGHGEFAVALRCGLIDGGQARLFAGCGIVADSDPQVEFAESCLKFQAMEHALGKRN
jgi:menaquinone-specific isochorismate synthase